MKICLSKPNWYSKENIWVTGYVRVEDKYLTKDELLSLFIGTESLLTFEKILTTANGQFSVIIKKDNEIWAASDRLRNYPVFYAWINGEFIISDDCYFIADLLPERILNNVACDCFLSAGFTLNSLTLFEGIYQVEAGEFICAGNSLQKDFYHNPSKETILNANFYSAAEELNKLLNDVFKCHLMALKDKFIAVPLSGGYDSRLVASMCAKYHPDNVLCFTYGRRDNREIALAKEASSRLGLKWMNVIYDSALINGYMDDGYFNDYYPYASNLSSMFYMQDYFAVRYLKENRIIPDDSVFMPGFSGDSLAGSFFRNGFKRHRNKWQISSQILNDKFVLINLDKERKEAIRMLINEKISEGICEYWKNYEEWEIKEIHSKFIINSAKVFSFFGYSYVLPLFDNHLIDFFTTIQFKFKLHKKLYDYVLTNYIFAELGLNLPGEINPKPGQKIFQRIKEKVKRFIPDSVIKHVIDQKSPVLYDEITKILIEETGKEKFIPPRQANYYNAYITQWYLAKTKQYLN